MVRLAALAGNIGAAELGGAATGHWRYTGKVVDKLSNRYPPGAAACMTQAGS
jgi:hypothetical protein